jgi:hypothetical protein
MFYDTYSFPSVLFSALLLKVCHKNKKSGECTEIRNLK